MSKEQFILSYIKNSPIQSVDILNQYFTDEYINKFKPKKIKYKLWGSHHIPELTRLLTKMYTKNLLNRQIYGLSNMTQGFPKWIYVYTISNKIYSCL